jgi:hypothetical protein
VDVKSTVCGVSNRLYWRNLCWEGKGVSSDRQGPRDWSTQLCSGAENWWGCGSKAARSQSWFWLHQTRQCHALIFTLPSPDGCEARGKRCEMRSSVKICVKSEVLFLCHYKHWNHRSGTKSSHTGYVRCTHVQCVRTFSRITTPAVHSVWCPVYGGAPVSWIHRYTCRSTGSILRRLRSKLVHNCSKECWLHAQQTMVLQQTVMFVPICITLALLLDLFLTLSCVELFPVSVSSHTSLWVSDTSTLFLFLLYLHWYSCRAPTASWCGDAVKKPCKNCFLLLPPLLKRDKWYR